MLDAGRYLGETFLAVRKVSKMLSPVMYFGVVDGRYFCVTADGGFLTKSRILSPDMKLSLFSLGLGVIRSSGEYRPELSGL